MTELRITPQLPEYPKIEQEAFLLMLDGKLHSRTETLKFLKPYAPPPPPPPPPPRKGKGAKAEAAPAAVPAAAAKKGKGKPAAVVAPVVTPKAEKPLEKPPVRAAKPPVAPKHQPKPAKAKRAPAKAKKGKRKKTK
jgi:hypothetical protein